MTTEEILQIAKIFCREFGIKKIRLTGGEPLINPDFDKIFRGLSKLPVNLAITTNGVLLDKYLSLFDDIGLDSVNISMDSLRAKRFEKITRRPYLNKVNNNIEKALAKDYHIKVNVVVIKGLNDDEILDFVYWTKTKNIHVRFIEYMPFNGNTWCWEKVISFKDILSKVKHEFNVIKLVDSPESTAKKYRVKGFRGSFAIISSVTNPFCTNCNRIRLTSDGKIKNCLFANTEFDLLSAWRKGEDIRPVIQNAIAEKKEQRAGKQDFSVANASNAYQIGRSMSGIGG